MSKTYLDYGNVLQCGDTFIPKDVSNRHYQRFLEEERRQEATIIQGKVTRLDWDAVRFKRNSLLAQSDWSQLPDAQLSENQRSLWRAYRQALRDLPEKFSDPTAVLWPKKPILN